MIALILHHAMPVIAGAGIAHAAYKPKPKTLRRRKVSPQGAEGPDATLIALCTEFVADDDDYYAGLDVWCSLTADDPRYPALDAKLTRFIERRNELRGLISDLPATTEAGLVAKARVALRDIAEDDRPLEPPKDDQYWTAWSVCRDLLRRAAS